jgi:hypothetical protein
MTAATFASPTSRASLVALPARRRLALACALVAVVLFVWFASLGPGGSQHTGVPRETPVTGPPSSAELLADMHQS